MVCIWQCAIFAQLSTLPEKKKAFSFKIQFEENTQTHKIKSLCILLWNQTDIWIILLWGREDKARLGWFLWSISDILLENCWSQKTRPKFQIWHLHIFSVQNLLSQGHAYHSPQGRELFRVGRARWGNLPWQLQQMGTQERDPTETLHLKLPSLARSSGFLRPEQMGCKASRHSSYWGLRKRWAS